MSERKPRLLDLFCGAGGCSVGYHRAGFDVFGVDISSQKNYPFKTRFLQVDAMDALRCLIEGNRLAFPDLPLGLGDFDAIHASPPCQKYTRMNQGLLASQGRAKKHPDLVVNVRQKLIRTGKPYVMENVPGAPLINFQILCGSSFGLLVQRHRLFECSFYFLAPQCVHGVYVKDKPPLHRLTGRSRVVGCYGNGRGRGDDVRLWSVAMQIDWMTRKELAQAIPPAYTKFIGETLIEVVRAKGSAA